MASSTDPDEPRRPRRPLQASTLDGEPALLIPRWEAAPRRGRAILLGIVVACLAAAVVLSLRGEPTWAGVLLLCGLVLAGVLVRDTIRMPYRGGLWLTPTRIVHRLGRSDWELPWDDVIAEQVEGEDGVLLTRFGGRQVVRAHLLVTDTQTTLMTVIALNRSDPTRRAHLGSPESVREAEEIRRLREPADFRPRVQGAIPTTRRGIFAASLAVAVVLLGLGVVGRSLSVDDDALARTLREQLSVNGREPDRVTCEGGIRRRVGGRQTCHAEADGQRYRVEVRVTAVVGDKVSYDARIVDATS